MSGPGSENRLVGNVTSQNGRHGFIVSPGHPRLYVEANQSQGNQGCGLTSSVIGGLIYRDNIFADNTGGNLCGATGVNAGGNYCDVALCP